MARVRTPGDRYSGWKTNLCPNTPQPRGQEIFLPINKWINKINVINCKCSSIVVALVRVGGADVPLVAVWGVKKPRRARALTHSLTATRSHFPPGRPYCEGARRKSAISSLEHWRAWVRGSSRETGGREEEKGKGRQRLEKDGERSPQTDRRRVREKSAPMWNNPPVCRATALGLLPPAGE